MMDLDQYRLILESSPNMIWRANLAAECDYFNTTWLEFTGRTYEQEYGFGWAEGVHPDDLDRCVTLYLDHFKQRKAFEMDYRLLRKDGEYRWINDRGVPFYNEQMEFIGFIGSCMDVTEKIEGRILMEMARNDSLCHIFNRQYSYQLLSAFFKTATENGAPLSIFMIDVDHFKSINDQYGHMTGDTVLAKIASTIKAQLRDDDVLGRFGGDEFIVGLMNTGEDIAHQIAERIREAVSSLVVSVPSGIPIRLSISIGIHALAEEETLESLIDAADTKLYEAKKHGRNLVKG